MADLPRKPRMCFSADASLGAAVVLLPIGGYCVAAALRKNRRYILLAAAPILFGFQQLCEAFVWLGLEQGDLAIVRDESRRFLFFALAVWPVWVPLSTAAIEPRGLKRLVFFALAAIGLIFGVLYYMPLAADDHWGGARIVGHSIRYDFAAIPAVIAVPGWVWPITYLAAVCGPFIASRDRRLMPLGIAIALAAGIAYLALKEAFASVWCFLGAMLSAYIAYVLYRLPARKPNESHAPGANSIL